MNDLFSADVLQIGAVAIIALFMVKEFFSYLKARKNNNTETHKDEIQDKELNSQEKQIYDNAKNIAVILQRLQTIETNHLPHLLREEEKNREEHKEIMKQLTTIITKLG